MRLRNVGRGSFLRLEVGVARLEDKISNWLRAQFGLESLRFGCAEIQRFKLAVKSDHVRQIVVKISCAERGSIFPEPLLESDVPAKIFFRLKVKVVAENFVLTARRTKSGCDARMQGRVRFVDLVTARDAVSPDVPELVEFIEASTGDENQILDVRGCLQKHRVFFHLIADECRPEQDERPLLTGFDRVVKQTARERQP